MKDRLYLEFLLSYYCKRTIDALSCSNYSLSHTCSIYLIRHMLLYGIKELDRKVAEPDDDIFVQLEFLPVPEIVP